MDAIEIIYFQDFIKDIFQDIMSPDMFFISVVFIFLGIFVFIRWRQRRLGETCGTPLCTLCHTMAKRHALTRS